MTSTSSTGSAWIVVVAAAASLVSNKSCHTTSQTPVEVVCGDVRGPIAETGELCRWHI